MSGNEFPTKLHKLRLYNGEHRAAGEGEAMDNPFRRDAAGVRFVCPETRKAHAFGVAAKRWRGFTL